MTRLGKCAVLLAVLSTAQPVVSIIAKAHDPTVEDFYRRNPLVILVGSGTGGGFDAYARLLAAHLARHIPGRPSIVVKNMPGANGLVAMNYINASAPRDGTTILAAFHTSVLSPLFRDPNARYDPRELKWLGSLGKQTATCLTWHKSPIKTIEDAVHQKVLVAGTGEGSTPVVFPRLLNTILGTKFKVVTGYSTTGMRLAVENGEVSGICGVAYETHMASVPDWIIDHKVHWLIQLGLSRNPHLADVPLAMDFIKNERDRSIFRLIAIPQEFGRPLVAPPGTPKDRLEVLRKGIAETIRDKSYLSDAERAHQLIDPLDASQVEDLINQSYAAPREVLDQAAKYNATN